MRELSSALRAHLDSGATTLCWCWRLTRNDGEVLGFTDHDRNVSFDGVTYEAASGFTASEIHESVGLNVDNLDVSGAIRSDRLSADDLTAGMFDDAGVAIFRVNWSDPDQRVLVRAGSLGEVRRAGQAFTAEVRGLAHYLQQPSGRLFQYGCDADLGDVRCGVDVNSPAYMASGTVSELISSRVFVVSGIEAYGDGWFRHGKVKFTSGANAGREIEIKRHDDNGSGARIELWQSPSRPVTTGEGVTLSAGCDRTLATCRTKFANVVNYRGFPHMPGNDFLARIGGR